MTTMISWFGNDQRGPASVYIAADSRITWPETGRWDCGRKVFSSQRYPEIFGYCGDSYFPLTLLSRAIDMIDRDLLYKQSDNSCDKVTVLCNFIRENLESCTFKRSLKFELIYACRIGAGIRCQFCLHHISFAGNTWSQEGPIALPNKSQLLLNLGSGSDSMAKNLASWSLSSSGGTSRGVFSAFCDSLASGQDKSSGGTPQLVGLYRQGPGLLFGIVVSGKPYVLGATPLNNGEGVFEWRNEVFERCDPETFSLLNGAQPQPRPNDLK